MSGIDYRALLAKYMNHVASEEGSFFTVTLPVDEWTAEEAETLRAIADDCPASADGIVPTRPIPGLRNNR